MEEKCNVKERVKRGLKGRRDKRGNRRSKGKEATEWKNGLQERRMDGV